MLSRRSDQPPVLLAGEADVRDRGLRTSCPCGRDVEPHLVQHRCAVSQEGVQRLGVGHPALADQPPALAADAVEVVAPLLALVDVVLRAGEGSHDQQPRGCRRALARATPRPARAGQPAAPAPVNARCSAAPPRGRRRVQRVDGEHPGPGPEARVQHPAFRVVVPGVTGWPSSATAARHEGLVQRRQRGLQADGAHLVAADLEPPAARRPRSTSTVRTRRTGSRSSREGKPAAAAGPADRPAALSLERRGSRSTCRHPGAAGRGPHRRGPAAAARQGAPAR